MNTDCIDYNEEQLNALVEDIMKIHDFLIKEQGLNAVRPESRAKINSAAYACFVSKYGLPFNETHNYNDIYDQVSDFAYHLALDHPFADANKRTTVMTTLVLLYINEINTECSKHLAFSSCLSFLSIGESSTVEHSPWKGRKNKKQRPP